MIATDTVDVFITHPRSEAAWTSALSRVLRDAGLRVATSALDQDPRGVGDEAAGRMDDALRASRVWLLVMGTETDLSPTGHFEMGAAVFGDKQVITLLPAEAARPSLPALLRSREALVRDGPEETGRRVLAAISQDGSGSSAKADESSPLALGRTRFSHR